MPKKCIKEDDEKMFESERVTVYDWLRLIATIFVVIGHSAYLDIHTTYGGVSYTLPENLSKVYDWAVFVWLRYMSGWVYGFHMPLFFMLSGAVLGLRPIGTFDKVFRSKVKRLLIPYFIYGWLFMFPVKRLGNFYDNDSMKEAMRGFLSGADSGHLWFLTALFWCIIVFALYKKILDMLKIQSIYIVLLVGGLIQLNVSYIPFDVLGLKKGLGYMFYFALGYIFEIERSSNRNERLEGTKKVLLSFIIVCGIEILNKRFEILDTFFTIIVGSFMTYLLADILDRGFKGVKENRCWKFVITNLFYVYLFHDPMEYIVLRLFIGQDWLRTGIGCIAYTVCRTIVIFVISLILGEMIGQIKKYFRDHKCLGLFRI